MVNLPTSLEKLAFDPANYGYALALRDDIYERNPLGANPLLKGLVESSEVAVAQCPLYLEGTSSVSPRNRTEHGTKELWVQLEGVTALRAGGMRQRRDFVEARPGDVVVITGRGKRSFENASLPYSVGLVVDIVPLDITGQEAIEALSTMTDRNPHRRAAALVLAEQLDNGNVSPRTVYEYAHRNS